MPVMLSHEASQHHIPASHHGGPAAPTWLLPLLRLRPSLQARRRVLQILRLARGGGEQRLIQEERLHVVAWRQRDGRKRFRYGEGVTVASRSDDAHSSQGQQAPLGEVGGEKAGLWPTPHPAAQLPPLYHLPCPAHPSLPTSVLVLHKQQGRQLAAGAASRGSRAGRGQAQLVIAVGQLAAGRGRREQVRLALVALRMLTDNVQRQRVNCTPEVAALLSTSHTVLAPKVM